MYASVARKEGYEQIAAIFQLTADQEREHASQLFKALQTQKADGRHSVLFMLTDVVKEGTELVVFSDDPALIEKAFKGQLKDNTMWIPGMMSRKKQTVPPLQAAFGA